MEDADSEICDGLAEVSSTLGCCYNSMLNDTEFLGFLSAELFGEAARVGLVSIGQSSVWDVCEIDVSPACELLGSAPCNTCAVGFVAILFLLIQVLNEL